MAFNTNLQKLLPNLNAKDAGDKTPNQPNSNLTQGTYTGILTHYLYNDPPTITPQTNQNGSNTLGGTDLELVEDFGSLAEQKLEEDISNANMRNAKMRNDDTTTTFRGLDSATDTHHPADGTVASITASTSITVDASADDPTSATISRMNINNTNNDDVTGLNYRTGDAIPPPYTSTIATTTSYEPKNATPTAYQSKFTTPNLHAPINGGPAKDPACGLIFLSGQFVAHLGGSSFGGHTLAPINPTIPTTAKPTPYPTTTKSTSYPTTTKPTSYPTTTKPTIPGSHSVNGDFSPLTESTTTQIFISYLYSIMYIIFSLYFNNFVLNFFTFCSRSYIICALFFSFCYQQIFMVQSLYLLWFIFILFTYFNFISSRICWIFLVMNNIPRNVLITIIIPRNDRTYKLFIPSNELKFSTLNKYDAM